MHDWTLVSLLVNWKESSLIIKLLNNNSIPVDIVLEGIKSVSIPKWDEWGESVSINTVNVINDPTYKTMEIEMQSGDIIKAIAENINIPKD
ncbi:hypothetical protein CT362_004945 [Escherichia coli]|nr:hypothetical protein [Escherichia coli]EFI0102225.1 hypothetical protein [Escherichia coli]EFQ2027242.1 hypothetical protein [Escherichia coli]EHQ4292952.1 hypothetical protein [Escherichia coli]EHQ4302910.1 hypothetical protein [Escherichia coli]